MPNDSQRGCSADDDYQPPPPVKGDRYPDLDDEDEASEHEDLLGDDRDAGDLEHERDLRAADAWNGHGPGSRL